MKGDGNCLFRALSLVITATEDCRDKGRVLLCEYMIQMNLPVNGIPPLVYLTKSKMRQDGVWGTTDELMTASCWLHALIFVWHCFGKNIVGIAMICST